MKCPAVRIMLARFLDFEPDPAAPTVAIFPDLAGAHRVADFIAGQWRAVGLGPALVSEPVATARGLAVQVSAPGTPPAFVTDPAARVSRIVVLDDRETWGTLEGATVRTVDPDTLERLEAGEITADEIPGEPVPLVSIVEGVDR